MTTNASPPHIRLANEIAVQFRHREPAAAAMAIAAHIRDFWEPRMIARLVVDAEAGHGGLDPLTLSAAALLREAT